MTMVRVIMHKPTVNMIAVANIMTVITTIMIIPGCCDVPPITIETVLNTSVWHHAAARSAGEETKRNDVAGVLWHCNTCVCDIVAMACPI